jgi:hypothetical protein
MTSVKSQVETLLRNLPDNCTFEDVQYGVQVLDLIHKSEQSIRRDGAVSQEEANARFARLLENRN